MKRLLFALWALSALTTAYADNLVINEVMASNAGVAMSPATNFDSWIELYNPNTTAVNLSGMHLSNNPDNLTRWKMPSDIGTVPAHGLVPLTAKRDGTGLRMPLLVRRMRQQSLPLRDLTPR